MPTDQPDNRYPLTVGVLANQLAACGLAEGQTVLVHMAMSKLGYVVGGAETVILALLRVLGSTGTLMMPAHTSENTEPSDWQHPPVPESWWPIIRAHTPPFNPATTPSRQMGRVAELFRTWPGALRSSHPVGSFAARGRTRYLWWRRSRSKLSLGRSRPSASSTRLAAMCCCSV